VRDSYVSSSRASRTLRNPASVGCRPSYFAYRNRIGEVLACARDDSKRAKESQGRANISACRSSLSLYCFLFFSLLAAWFYSRSLCVTALAPLDDKAGAGSPP